MESQKRGESLVFIFVTEELTLLTPASKNSGITSEMFNGSKKDSDV